METKEKHVHGEGLIDDEIKILGREAETNREMRREIESKKRYRDGETHRWMDKYNVKIQKARKYRKFEKGWKENQIRKIEIKGYERVKEIARK